MTTDTRTTLNLPADLVKAVDNYWHAEQLRSRNEAIRDLLAYALNAKGMADPWKFRHRGAGVVRSDAQPAKGSESRR